MTTFCACGQPLHYTDPKLHEIVERMVIDMGADIAVRVSGRVFLVQRHFIALHGIKAGNLPHSKFPELLSDGKIFLPFKYASGGRTISLDVLDYANEIYHYRDPDTGVMLHFCINTLNTLCDTEPTAFGLINNPVMLAEWSIDESHFDRISTDMLDEPGLMVAFADGTQLIVDGHHRYVKRLRLGLPFMQFWVLQEEMWRKSLLCVPSQFDHII